MASGPRVATTSRVGQATNIDKNRKQFTYNQEESEDKTPNTTIGATCASVRVLKSNKRQVKQIVLYEACMTSI